MPTMTLQPADPVVSDVLFHLAYLETALIIAASGTSVTMEDAASGLTFTLTGSGLTTTVIGGKTYLDAGTVTGITATLGGNQVIDISGLALDAGDFAAAVQADEAGTEEAVENLFRPLDWTIIGTAGADFQSQAQQSFDNASLATGGNNIYRLGQGSDTVYAGSGQDRIFGGGDNDTLYGNDGGDTLSGGSGRDAMYGGKGRDVVKGGAQSDTLDGGIGDDALWGGAGDDLLSVSDGQNSLYGGAGNDTVFGGYDADRLEGGDGNDVFNGAFGNDTLFGDDGNDMLNGGLGVDVLFGGLGRDRFFFFDRFDTGLGAAADTISDFVSGTDLIDLRNIISNWLFEDDFTGAANEARWDPALGVIQIDTNGDRIADREIRVQGDEPLGAFDVLT